MKRCVLVLTALALLSLQVFALQQISVKKYTESTDINVGNEVNFALSFQNPFDTNIALKIVDKSVLGGNGYDIQCLERTIPPKSSVFEYGPIVPFTPGDFNVGAAKITYTNPQTGKEETVESNTLFVSVHGRQRQGQQQGITTVYQCNGISISSTSYSSSSTTTIQTGINPFQSNPFQQNQPVQNRVQNNQMNQNTSEIKKEIEKQAQQQNQLNNEFKKNLEKNKRFQQEQKKLTSKGYKPVDYKINATTPDTGSFNVTYRNSVGKEASIRGEMDKNQVKELTTQTPESIEKILRALRENKQFQKYDNYLTSHGFTQGKATVNQVSKNYSRIEVPYQDPEGKNRKITADYIDGEIKNVSLSGQGSEGNVGLWLDVLLLLLLCLLLAGTMWLFYKKYARKKPGQLRADNKTMSEKPSNYASEAKSMLSRAEELFREGKEKDACEKTAQAIRFYFSRKHGIESELNNQELLKLLKKKENKSLAGARECLNLCSLVEFAKHSAREKEFKHLLDKARELLRQ